MKSPKLYSRFRKVGNLQGRPYLMISSKWLFDFMNVSIGDLLEIKPIHNGFLVVKKDVNN